jgi:hypothetical protein
MAAYASVTASQVFSAAGSPVVPSWALLGPLAAWFARWAVLTAPIGVPVGMVAAAIPPRQPAVPTPEWDARQRRAREREQARTRKRATKRADREGGDFRSNALAVSLGGMVASWRIGDLIVPPSGQLGLAWLLIGAPGVGKSTAIERLAYLAGLERRHLTVLDAKGSDPAFARGIVAAYLAAWPDARVRLFPNEYLDIWRGDPQAIVNRLVEVWDWTAESSWYREPVMAALRMAVGQAGQPVRSGRELVRRLDPAALQRAWEHDPEILALARSMDKKGQLADVHIRVINLIAAMAGKLDGEVSWEDADCWVVTVPAMVASRDADSALRVLLSDYGHFTMARKGGRSSLLIVDEFSAIAGGRRSAIDLLERGRGANAGVVLAGQSSVALGNEEERARLLAAASAILLFRTPQPAELAALAGTERVAEGAWQADDQELTGRQTITMRARARVDQDEVRQLPTGEADLIVRGVKERVRIIRTAAPNQVVEQARELVAGSTRPRLAPADDARSAGEIPPVSPAPPTRAPLRYRPPNELQP